MIRSAYKKIVCSIESHDVLYLPTKEKLGPIGTLRRIRQGEATSLSSRMGGAPSTRFVGTGCAVAQRGSSLARDGIARI
jgi:hypothetical protein